MKANQRLVALLLVFGLGLIAGLLLRNSDAESTAHAQAQPEPEESAEEPLELAPFMTTLQTFSHKLGFAIQGRNQPLSLFYLYEIREAAGEIVREIPVYDGVPIDQLMVTMLYPQLTPLENALDEGDWDAADAAYTGTINACNTCHTASMHGFIHILPAEGTPPFNQKFTAD